MWAALRDEVLDADNPLVPAWRRALWERAIALVTPAGSPDDADEDDADADAWAALLADEDDGGNPDDDGGAEGRDALERLAPRVRGLPVLSVTEGMTGHWESETHASVLAWPWRLFCAKWVRLMEYGWREERRQRDRDDARRQGKADEAERDREARLARAQAAQDAYDAG